MLSILLVDLCMILKLSLTKGILGESFEQFSCSAQRHDVGREACADHLQHAGILECPR